MAIKIAVTDIIPYACSAVRECARDGVNDCVHEHRPRREADMICIHEESPHCSEVRVRWNQLGGSISV